MNIDTNNFADMAQKMGMGVDMTQKKQTAQLARLKIQHSPIMGEVEVKGKKTQAAIVNSGSYKIDDLSNESVFYSDDITIRPYVQRFMYKKFVKPESGKGFYVKTIMADNLNVDLKDNMGGFNCGKPAGYVKDYQALPPKTKDLLKSIKRVRVLIGTLSAGAVLNADGNDAMEIANLPFIWEVDNRDAFKIMGEPISKIGSRKHLPVQYTIGLGSEERKLPNGNSYYLPTASLNKDMLDVEDDTQDNFTNFMQWIENYNSYIFNAWNEKAKPTDTLTTSDRDIVKDLVDVDDGIPF
jgi:hypothetical protein